MPGHKDCAPGMIGTASECYVTSQQTTYTILHIRNAALALLRWSGTALLRCERCDVIGKLWEAASVTILI
jgi:hypothetical protein